MGPLLIAAAAVLGADPPSTTTFERVFGGPDADRGVFVSRTSDGGYVAVGVTESAGEGGEDVYLVKTDSDGELLWSRTYGGAEQDNGWSVRELADGFIIAGYTRSFGSGGFDFYLVRTDPEGKAEWTRTYGGERDDRCWALALCADGGFVLAGETLSAGAGEEDVLLVKTDASGKELWSRTYGGEKGDRCFSVVQADDGGYVLAGQTYSEGAGDRDAYVIKTKANGEREWSKTFGGAASDVGHCVVRTSDGAFVVTGYTTSLAEVDDDPYLIKIDADGETQWTRVLPLEGVNHTITGAEAAGGGFYLVGFSEHPRKRTNAALLVRAKADGHLDWHREILPTRRGRSLGYTVSATPDGGCVFTGQTSTSGAGGLDLLLVKVAGDDVKVEGGDR